MTAGTTRTTTPQAGTVLYTGGTLFVCQTVFLQVMTSTLGWFFLWLFPAGPAIIAAVAMIVTLRWPPLSGWHLWLFLPFALYTSGLISVMVVWWITGYRGDFLELFLQKDSIPFYNGTSGSSAALLWAACLARSWQHERSQRSQQEIQ